jgi:beta-xylosidase
MAVRHMLTRVKENTYTNPVYRSYFADPYVLKVGDVYYAYGTGSIVDGRAFEVLTSDDLVDWRSLGGALEPCWSPPESRDSWAPEVALGDDGVFYMYYSIGVRDKNHHLRVATADTPEGPFRDSGRVLTPDEPFAIDPHPFRDDDGTWYLFYARDFLEGERVGTALAVDRLSDMLTLEGDWRTVIRASADWQIFRADRSIYDSVYDWYAVEGPFVRKRGGRYYCFYSGGAWEHPNYGVSYAVADSPLGPYQDKGDEPSVLRSVPDKVIGPGHNSIVEGPDGEDYIVYHAWDPDRSARSMCIDRLRWGPDGPLPSGPTYTPQPAPRRRPS